METALILGFFDGVHLAHKAVVTSALGCKNSIVMTFKTSPAEYFGQSAEYILSRKNSIEKLKEMGVSEIVELDFEVIANQTAQEYLETLIDRYHPNIISTGFNHTFGKNKLGDCEFLKQNQEKYDYKYICIPPYKINGETVSSTLIRNYLIQGNIETANNLLDSNFILEGTVIKGLQLGRKLGFPTANIKYPEKIVKIPFGVYKCEVFLDKRYDAILNWGIKPTINKTKEPILEAHILDFDGDLYGKDIKIEVLDKIRNEQKFDNLEELKEQIKKDVEICLK